MTRQKYPAPILSGKQLRRFEAKIDKSGDCWLWTAHRNPRGYGVFGVTGVKSGVAAHRLAWAVANNQEVPAGMVICHRCDNPSCVRADHLFLGTQAENLRDARLKGRFHGRCNIRLTPRCSDCNKPRRETWVWGKTNLCADCYAKRFNAAKIIPLHRLKDAKQLNLFAEAA